MQRLIFAITLLLNCFWLRSQEFTYQYGQHEIGKTSLLFGDNVNIREQTSTNAKIVDKLPIATAVIIIENTKIPLTLNGYNDYWYKIEYSAGKQGYVWGGLLAKSYTNLNNGLKIVAGIVKTDKDSKTMQARLVNDDNNTILSSYDFEPIELGFEGNTFNYCTYAKQLNAAGLTPPIDLVELNFTYGACDYPNGNVYLVIQHNTIKKAFQTLWSSNEMGGLHIELILPSSKNGIPNKIIEIRTSKFREDEMDTTGHVIIDTVMHIWSNNQFINQE